MFSTCEPVNPVQSVEPVNPVEPVDPYVDLAYLKEKLLDEDHADDEPFFYDGNNKSYHVQVPSEIRAPGFLIFPRYVFFPDLDLRIHSAEGPLEKDDEEYPDEDSDDENDHWRGYCLINNTTGECYGDATKFKFTIFYFLEQLGLTFPGRLNGHPYSAHTYVTGFQVRAEIKWGYPVGTEQ